MKTSFVKKILVVSLAATLALGCSLTAFAACGGASTSSSSASNVVAPATTATVSAPATASAPEVQLNVAAGASTTQGTYLADAVKGSAVSTPIADIKSAYSLAKGEAPYIKTYNVDAKKSAKVMSVFNAVASSQGAVVGPCVNIDFGKMAGGKFALLPADGSPVIMKFALKNNFFQAGKNYAVICVRPGGAFTIIPATVDAKGVLSFAMNGGKASYAVIKF